MDQLTERMNANFKLIQENTEKLAGAQPSNGICPNEGRLKMVEGTVDEVGQDHRNFSLILTGLGFNYQNNAGIVGFARDVLGVFIDPTEISEVIKLGINRQGKTVTKVIFLSVGTRLKILPG